MKILIGTPVYDDQVFVPYYLSMLRLLNDFSRQGVAFDTALPTSSFIINARNALATQVLEDKSYSHLLFIDYDMGFQPSLIAKMIAIDQPVTAAIYPKRAVDYTRLVKVVRERPDETRFREVAQDYVIRPHLKDGGLEVRGDFIRALHAGTGIMLIRRDALETLRERFPELWAESDPTGTYGPMGITGGVFQPFNQYRDDHGVYLTEDYSFSRRWQDCGGDIWACYNETITHVGRERFVGNYEHRLQARI